MSQIHKGMNIFHKVSTNIYDTYKISSDEHTSSSELSSDISRLPISIEFDDTDILKHMTNQEILRQKSEIDKISEALATSTEDAERLWLADIHRAIASSLFHLQSYMKGTHLVELDQVVAARAEIVKLAIENDPLFPGQLASLCHALHLRFRHSNQLQDIDEALELYRDALWRISSAAERIRIFYSLSWALKKKFDHTKERSSIDEAIDAMQHVVDNVDPEDPDYFDLHPPTTLTTFLLLRYERIGDLTQNDLGRAVDIQCKEIDRYPGDAAPLNMLGVIHRSWFLRTKELMHIDMAIDAFRKALSLMPKLNPMWFTVQLHYRKSIESRHLETWNLEDLEEAIALQLYAIQACQDDNLARLEYNNLGELFRRRYLHTQNIGDAQNSANAYREAVHRTPSGHGNLPEILIELGRTLCLGDSLAGISEAVSCLQQAVDIIVSNGFNDPKYLLVLGLLGKTLLRKYSLSDNQNDLNDAVNALWKSVIECPRNHRALPNNLLQLAMSLETHFGSEKLQTVELKVIDDAVSSMYTTIDILTLAGKNRSKYDMLHDLGKIFYLRHKVTDLVDDIRQAVSLFREVTMANEAKAVLRFLSGTIWGRLCMHDQDQGLNGALEAFNQSFEHVIPQLAWIGYTVEHRYTLLTNLDNDVREAISVAVRCGEYNLAIQWLEQGRTIVWNQINGFRMPIDEIRKVDPALSEEIETIGTALNKASTRMRKPWDADEISIDEDTNSQHLTMQWDSLLARVRSIPGFEYFLRYHPGLSSALLSSLPPKSLVIAINLHSSTCNVLVQADHIPNGILNVQLGDIYNRAVFLQENLYKLLSNPAARMRTERAGRLVANITFSMKDILKELWYKIVNPIFDAIGLKPTSNPPRIWWCPTGPLAFLPLHAAGDFSSDAPLGSNIMDYAISSYTPTLTTLAQGLTKHYQRNSHQFKGLLALSQPDALNLPCIPNTSREVQILEKLFQASGQTFTCKEGVDATVNQVLEDMPSCSWIHLSCHALQNESPLKSGFYLHDGPITLKDIMKHPLSDAQFAFLSACETGKGDKKLSGEAVHLAGGMLAAGYTSVVATMWSIKDDYAPLVVKEFYTHLLQSRKNGVGIFKSGIENTLYSKDSGGRDDASLLSKENKEAGPYPDCTRAAAALHHAIKHLRMSVAADDETLMLWVPYIHVGI